MKVPFTNNSNKAVHIGAVTVAAHSTREVEKSHIPPSLLEDNAEEMVVLLATVLAGSIPELEAALEDAFSITELEELLEAEKKDKDRAGAIAAIKDRLEILASLADLDEYVAELKNPKEYSDEELEEERLGFINMGDEGMAMVVQSVIDSRSEGEGE